MADKKDINNEPIEVKGVRVTHPGKILYPESKITKLDIINYYIKVEKKILPFLQDRTISMVRSPGGIEEGSFYQKHPSEDFPDYIKRVKIKEKEGIDTYVTVDEIKDLVYLVQLGVLEFHVGNSLISDYEHPTRIIFDLDPGEDTKYNYLVEGAYELKDILDEAKLKNSVKTSGGKGFHIIAELGGKMKWDEAKGVSLNIAQILESKFPDKFTTHIPKKDRVGKVFIDYLRNDRSATAVCAYSTRARAKAPISMPISWKDVEKVKPNEFTIKDLS